MNNWKSILEEIKELPSSKQRKLFRQLKKLLKGKSGKTRKVNPALLKELKCSKELKAVTGKSKLSRGKAMKYTWKYIKAHKLQDKKDARQINPDKVLAAVIGKKPILMTKLGGLIFKHLSDN